MNKRTGKRLLLILKMLGSIVGLMTVVGLMMKFAPWMILVVFVGWLVYMLWDMTGDLVD